tara:strand:+ start:147 stop:920 length:774 start_codon:yes stop_codon:yes gene_type:complete
MEISIKGGRPIDDPSYARIGYLNKITSAVTASTDAVLIPNTFERWTTSTGTVTASFNIGNLSTVNYIAIGAHNLFSAGVTNVRVQCKTSAGSFITVATIKPQSNSPIYFEFNDFLLCAQVSVTITGGTNREIGIIYAGQSLIMQRALFGGHNPINLSSMTEYRNSMSDSGQFLGRRIKRKGQQSSFAWANITDEWYRDNFQPFVNAAKTTPFFIKTRPDYYVDEVAFGYTTADISPSNQGGTTRMLSVNFTMRAHDE